jgi:hypothetical protein
VARAGRRLEREHIHVSGRTLRTAAAVPLAAVTDFGILALALARSVAERRVARDRYVEREVDPGPMTTPAGRARRAWLALLAGYSPNAYLVDVDPETGIALLHDLVPWRG